jgi:hypothetical protein
MRVWRKQISWKYRGGRRHLHLIKEVPDAVLVESLGSSDGIH